MKRVSEKILYRNTQLPRYHEKRMDGESFIYHIIKGYKKMMIEIVAKKELLLCPESPLSGFENLQVRQVLRPTYFYSRLIEGSYNPRYLTDKIHRESFLSKIKKYDNYDMNNEILESEIHYMLDGDIPLFSTISTSTSLFINSIENKNFFNHTTYNRIRQNIKEINKKKIEEQIDMVVGSLDAYSNVPFLKNKNRILYEATIIADEILEKYILSNDESSGSWNSHKYNHYGNLNYETMGIDLYSGLSGMLLFYGKIYMYTKEEKYLKVTHQILETITYELKMEDIKDISLFNDYLDHYL